MEPAAGVAELAVALLGVGVVNSGSFVVMVLAAAPALAAVSDESLL